MENRHRTTGTGKTGTDSIFPFLGKWCLPLFSLFLGIALLGSSCGENPQGVDGGFFPARGRTLFVVNGLSETLSAVRLEDDSVFDNVMELGRWPNGIESDPERGSLFVVNSGDNNVMDIDLATGDVSRHLDVGIGRNPWECVRGGDLLWVSAFLTGEAIAIDESGAATHHKIGTTLQAIAVFGDALYVTDTAYQYGSFGRGSVVKLNPVSGAEVGRSFVGTNPQDIIEDDAGRLHVACSGSFTGSQEDAAGEVHILDAATMTPLDTLFLGGSPSSLAQGSGGVIYAAGYWGGVMAYEAASLTVLHDASNPLLAGEGFMDMVPDEATGKLVIADFDEDRVLLIDPLAGGTPDRLFAVGDGPVRLLIFEEVRPIEK
jgi:DNA-binding beta-propeller fold protein YncE